MPLPEARPVRMARVAVVAPKSRLREALATLGDMGLLEFEETGEATENTAQRILRKAGVDAYEPALAPEPPDLTELEKEGRWDLLAGEAALQQHVSKSIEHGSAAVMVGWTPESSLNELTARLAVVGASVARLGTTPTASPPTLVSDSPLTRSLRPLVETYAVIPYEDVDPTLFAGITYVLMFGMMFGDVGQGLMLALAGVALARTRRPRLQRFSRFWVFAVAAGLTSCVFGALYGEFFGPTGVLPVLWLSPLDEPIELLVAGIGLGAVLLGFAYVLGIINRWREGGPSRALYAATGIAGALLFFGSAVAVIGWLRANTPMEYVGGVTAGLGVALLFIGYVVRAGAGAGAFAQALIELLDTIIRLGANVVSFGRLAAFGLTHAAIGSVVWDATQALWGPGLGAAGAVAVFVIGNAAAFALEALVVGIQALRLEYYELFSRILTGEGRLFRPWHVSISREETA